MRIIMQRVSDYFTNLSAESKARYSSKVLGVGLRSNPYAIPSESWVGEPDAVPAVAWSDMCLYMISTPSAYTREELKVLNDCIVIICLI